MNSQSQFGCFLIIFIIIFSGWLRGIFDRCCNTNCISWLGPHYSLPPANYCTFFVLFLCFSPIEFTNGPDAWIQSDYVTYRFRDLWLAISVLLRMLCLKFRQLVEINLILWHSGWLIFVQTLITRLMFIRIINFSAISQIWVMLEKHI